MNPNFQDKVQSTPYDPLKINADDINSLKYSVISKIDRDELDAEIAARKAGDIAITNATDAKLTSKASTSALNDEATLRQISDAALQTSINSKASNIDLQNEITNRVDSFNKLSSTFNNTIDKDALAKEASLRTSGDATLQSNIDGKVSQTAFNTEVALRISGDSDVKNLINNVSFGIGSALPSDSPVPSIKTYNVSVAGTYTNFSGIVVTTGDTTSGLVQLTQTANSSTWTKVVTPIALGNYINKSTDLSVKAIQGKNKFNVNDFLNDTAISSVDGSLITFVGRKTSKPIPVTQLPYTLTLFNANLKRFRWLDINGIPLTGGGSSIPTPSTFTSPPTGAAFFQFNFKLETETDAQVALTQFEQNSNATTFVSYLPDDYTLLSVNGAKTITTENVVSLIATNTTGKLDKSSVSTGTLNEQRFDKTVFNDNQFINTGDGTFGVFSGFRTYVVPKILNETEITISGLINPQSGKAWRFEKENGDLVSWAVITTSPFSLTWPVNATQLRFTFKRNTDAESAGDTVMVNTGNQAKPYEAFLGTATTAISGVPIKSKLSEGLVTGALMNGKTVATTDQIPDVTSLKTKTDAFNILYPSQPNILNPATYELSTVLAGVNGTTQSSTFYDTSDFIPVDSSTLYNAINQNEIKAFRIVSFYTSNKTWISTLNDSNFINSFTTPANCAFARVNILKTINNAGVTQADKTKIGLFKGASPVFSYYGSITVEFKDNSKSSSDKTDSSVASIKDIKELAKVAVNAGVDLINYEYSSGTLKVTQSNGDYIRGILNANRSYTGNNMFNFIDYSVSGNYKANADDVAPTHTQNTTLGANHGQPVAVATVTAHGLNNSHIGTQWLTSGNVRFYVMRIVDANTIIFLSHNIGNRIKPTFNTLSTGNLTRNGVTLSVTAVNTANQQLYSSITNLNKKVLIDGVYEITSGTGSAKYVDVVESYEIMSVDDILNNIIARDGTGNASDPVYTGSSMFRVENIYRFIPNSAVIVIVNVKALDSGDFTDVMGSQAIPIGVDGVTQYYVPNSSPTGVHDFRTPLAVTWNNSSLSSDFFTVASSPEPTNPPNRVVQYYNNIGFMLGFLKTRGVGKALPNYTNRTFELRNNTGKVYPHGLEGTKIGTTIQPNTVYNMVLYRSFTNLNQTRTGGRMSYFNFNYEGVEYIYADYSASMIDNLNVNKVSLNGKLIEVIESKNSVLNTDVYNNGAYVTSTYVTGQTSFIVLAVK